MKTLAAYVIGVILFFGHTVLASDSAPHYPIDTLVEKERVQEYKDAMLIAFNRSGMDSECNSPFGYYDVKSTLSESWGEHVDLYVLNTNTPLIAIRINKSEFNQSVGDWLFYTNEDYTEIIKVELVTYNEETEIVNAGNLKNPDITTLKKFSKIYYASCSVEDINRGPK